MAMVMMMRIVEEVKGKKEKGMSERVSLGFVCVVLVFLEESKEWFLGCGERRKKGS